MGPVPKARMKWGKAKTSCTVCHKLYTETSMKNHWRQTHRGIPYQTIPGASVDPAVTTANATKANAESATATNATATNATATNSTTTNNTTALRTARNARTATDDSEQDFGQGFGDWEFEEGLDDSLQGAIEDGFGETMPMLELNDEDYGLSSETRADVLITISCSQHETFPNAGISKMLLIT